MADIDPLFRLLLQITLILAACRAIGLVGRYVGQAQAVCDMVAGIALGPSILGAAWPSLQAWLFPQQTTIAVNGAVATVTHPAMSTLYALAQLGLVLYMFLVGVHFDARLFRGRIRSVGLVSLTGIAVPFVLGAAAALWLLREPAFFPPTIRPWQAALFIGASMSITAFPVLARILHEKGLSATRLGTTALAAGALDDVIAWCLLAVMLSSLRAEPAGALFAVGGGLAFGIGMPWVGSRVLRVLGRWADRDGGLTATTLVTALLVLMMSAAFTDVIGIHSVFGAFIAGTAMPRGRFAADIGHQLEPLTTTLLLPLFFVYSGLNTRVALLNTPWLWSVAALIIVLAVTGKGVACALAARMSGEGWRESAALGTLMNARGLVELIMLNVGLQAGIITPTLFTILVIMAIVTTIMTSPLFHYFYGRFLPVRPVSVPQRAAVAAK